MTRVGGLRLGVQFLMGIKTQGILYHTQRNKLKTSPLITFHIIISILLIKLLKLQPSHYILQYLLQKRTLMGLDYLNKKVWHPGSMKNIQKVWQVEQQQKQINKKTRERAKKLLEQQHNEELKRIQVEAGLIPRSHLDRMEWMYDWGNKITQQKTNEEFLTGQKVAEAGDKNFKHVFQEEITNRKCEDFQLLHEDPMYEIMKKEKAMRDAITNNPIEMRNIIKEVEKEYLPQDYEERRKKHYSKKRQSSSSRSSSSSSERRNKKKRGSKKTKEGSRSRSRSRERERQREREKKYEDSKSDKSQKKSFKQSKIYQEYLKDRFGPIVKKDENGNLKPDYSTFKSKYRTQQQIDEDQRRMRLQKLRENARKLQQLKGRKYSQDEPQQEKPQYEQGAAKIRKSMMSTVKQNRNHKSYRHSDSE